MSNNPSTFPYHAEQYLRNIGMATDYDHLWIPCEICGDENLEIIQEYIDIGKDQFGKLPVHGCRNCGYVFHSERFEERFYRDFYEKHYRSVLFDRITPEKAFVADQVQRGWQLYENISQYLPNAGRLLDVGCSCGGLMVGFRDHGWEVYGTDPDLGFAKFGRDRLKLPVDCMYAEDMDLAPESIDLILITGSLEHVYNLGNVLNICRTASAPNALIIVEGRALGFSQIKGCFSHTHRRYFDIHSLPLALSQFGWTPELVTSELLSGHTRPGGVFCIARVTATGDVITAVRSAEEINAHFAEIREKTSRNLPKALNSSGSKMSS